jgi:hypothetical protein
MPRMSAWMELEASLRRLNTLRETPAQADRIAIEIEVARDLWEEVSLSPAGMALEWPPDIHPLARELGFDPDTRLGRGSAAMDPALGRAALIHEVIEEAVEIRELNVAMSGVGITITGFAADAAERERAGFIAAQLEAESQIRNEIVVDKQ